jgi:hypothetical protein
MYHINIQNSTVTTRTHLSMMTVAVTHDLSALSIVFVCYHDCSNRTANGESSKGRYSSEKHVTSDDDDKKKSTSS